MKILQESTAFDIISTFGKVPEFSEKDTYILWLNKAGLIQEAEELETLCADDFYDLFMHFLEIRTPNFIQ